MKTKETLRERIDEFLKKALNVDNDADLENAIEEYLKSHDQAATEHIRKVKENYSLETKNEKE